MHFLNGKEKSRIRWLKKVAETVHRSYAILFRTAELFLYHRKRVRRTSEEWFSLETEFWCDKCNRFVEYHKDKDVIECRCGEKEASKTYSCLIPRGPLTIPLVLCERACARTGEEVKRICIWSLGHFR